MRSRSRHRRPLSVIHAVDGWVKLVKPVAGYANGGVPPGIHPGIGGAAFGTVDAGADEDVEVRPRLGGDPGVGVLVTPAPPSAGAELDDEVVVDVVLVSVLLVSGGDG